MATKRWDFSLDDGAHSVVLQYSGLSARKQLQVDGGPPQTLPPPGNRFSLDADYPFRVGSHDALLLVRNKGLRTEYDVAVDGLSLTTGLRPAPAPAVPAWGWVFVILCALLLTGGAIGGGIGAAGALACIGAARDGTKPVAIRVGLCIGITVLCWIAYVVLATLFRALIHRH